MSGVIPQRQNLCGVGHEALCRHNDGPIDPFLGLGGGVVVLVRVHVQAQHATSTASCVAATHTTARAAAAVDMTLSKLRSMVEGAGSRVP